MLSDLEPVELHFRVMRRPAGGGRATWVSVEDGTAHCFPWAEGEDQGPEGPGACGIRPEAGRPADDEDAVCDRCAAAMWSWVLGGPLRSPGIEA